MSLEDSMPSLTRSVVVSVPDERPSYALSYATYTLVVTGSDTAGAYALFDGFVPPGGGAPPHCHAHQELLLVIEGELEVFYDESHVTLGPLAGVNIPSWTPHTYRNFSEVPARLLITASPAGYEGYYREIGQKVMTRTSLLPISSETDHEELERLKLEGTRRHNGRVLPEDMFDHLMTNLRS